jgi:hypothetical protein
MGSKYYITEDERELLARALVDYRHWLDETDDLQDRGAQLALLDNLADKLGI